MSFQYKKASPFELAALPTLDPNPQASFGSSYELAYRAIELNDTSISQANALEEVWEPIIEEMNSRQTDQTFYNPSVKYRTGIFNEEYQEQEYSNAVTSILNEIETNEAFADLRGKFDRNSIFEQAVARAREANEAFEKNSAVSSGFGTFVGTAHATLNDPVLVGSMLFGGAKGLWQMALQEMAIGAASEAVIQTKVKEWYESTGQEYTDEKFRNAVLYGGALGFATPFAFKGAGMGFQATGKAVNFTVDQLKQGISVMREAGIPSTARGRFAEELADEIEAVNNANPLDAPAENPLPAQTEHIARVEEAAVAAEKNVPPRMSEEPKVPARPLTVADVDEMDPTVYPFDPNKLEVDAEKFQFKSGGDEFGVTERLQGVTKWNPFYADEILVWERADGTQFVVDGHQRTGLARRIMANDPGQKIIVNGKKLNETEGWTAETARALAALKNISQGSGTGLDAAKVLKEDPNFVRELPPKSALVRDANGLVELSDKNFLAVINGVVKESYGAIVGRLIKDEGLQEAAIAVLAKTQPANNFQAESIVRQVMEAGAETRTQETLFGEEIITESYFAERAKILDQTVTQLRKDRASFNNLVKNKERLEQEGNKIVEGANKRRADNDAQAIAILQAVANRKGPISDALTAAARTARDTGSFAQPVNGFIEAVRRGIRDGDFDGATLSDGRSLENDTPQGSPRPAEPEPDVALFDEPAGAGAQRQASQLQNDIETDLEAERLGEIDLDDEPRLYFDQTEDSYLMPVSMITPIRAREQGIANSKINMRKAAQGLMNKRKPLSVIPNEDGTFTLADGNSTYAVAIQQGWNSLPVRIMSREQFVSEEAEKAATKIAIIDDKKKARVLRVEDLADTDEGVGSFSFSQFDDTIRHKQNFKSVDDIIERATPRQEQLNKDVAEFAIKENEGKDLLEEKILYLPGKVKSKERLIEKIRDEYDGDADLIIDSARTLFVLPKPDDVEKVIKFFLSKDYHVVWKGWGQKGQYTDGKMTVQKVGTTELMEVQIHNKFMLLAKESQDVIDLLRFNDTDEGFARLKGALGGHDLYKISREYFREEAERLEAIAKMDDIYGDALSKASADADWARLISSLDTSAPAASARNMKSASDISGDQLSLTRFSESSEYQRPLRDDQATARLPSEETAAGVLPSKEKNLIDEPPTETVTDITQEIKDVPADPMAAMRSQLFRAIDEEKNQIPVGLTEDGAARTMTRKELLDDIKQDQKMLDRLRDCAQ